MRWMEGSGRPIQLIIVKTEGEGEGELMKTEQDGAEDEKAA
jgi:hypothetical protein